MEVDAYTRLLRTLDVCRADFSVSLDVRTGARAITIRVDSPMIPRNVRAISPMQSMEC
jgi:hypothetical protein